jgi:tetratricopeptide (TPR) repeat protein
LRHLVEVDPGSMAGFSMLGQVYLAQRRLDEARAEFDKRARADAKDASSRLIVGMILEMQNKIPEAKQKYDEVLAINPDSMVAANNLAYLYAETRENLERALTLAQTAVGRAPDDPNVRDTLGWVYYQRDLNDLAVRAFEESLAKNPNNPLVHYHLGLASAKQGNLVRARRSYQAALKLKPDFPDAERALKTIGG